MTKQDGAPTSGASFFFACGMDEVGGHKCPPAERRGEQKRKKKWRFKKKRNGVKEKWKNGVDKNGADNKGGWSASGIGGRGKKAEEMGQQKKGVPFGTPYKKLAATYFSTNKCSIIGDVRLNFSVRNGKR